MKALIVMVPVVRETLGTFSCWSGGDYQLVVTLQVTNSSGIKVQLGQLIWSTVGYTRGILTTTEEAPLTQLLVFLLRDHSQNTKFQKVVKSGFKSAVISEYLN